MLAGMGRYAGARLCLTKPPLRHSGFSVLLSANDRAA